MNGQKKKNVASLMGVLEILLLSLVYYQIWDLYRTMLGKDLFHFRGKFFLIGLYIIISALTFHACESFKSDKLKFGDLCISQCISCLIVNAITWLQVCLVVNGVISPIPLLILTVIDFVICILFSAVITRYFHGNSGVTDGLLICGTGVAETLKDKINQSGTNLQIGKMIPSSMPLEELYPVIDSYQCIVINDVPAEKRNDLLKYCFSKDKSIYVVPKITDIIMKGTEEISSYDTPFMRVKTEGLSSVESFAKRLLDLAVSVLAMIPGSILMLAIAIAIKLEDGGPIFYTQQRVTLDGKVFRIYKFRSMIVNAEEGTGAVLALEEDPRITKVGKFLRSCRLDEFPQFLNILKGEMSLVGPRPERVELTEQFIKEMPEYAYRTKVKAGLTGYAQVYGKYNTNNYDKLRLDLIYIEQYSLLLDIKLILMTPQILFRKEATEGVKMSAKTISENFESAEITGAEKSAEISEERISTENISAE